MLAAIKGWFSSTKGRAINDIVISLAFMVLMGVNAAHRSDPILTTLMGMNAAIFAFGGGSGLMRHVTDKTAESRESYIAELEAYNRELRVDYYTLIGQVQHAQQKNAEAQD